MPAARGAGEGVHPSAGAGAGGVAGDARAHQRGDGAVRPVHALHLAGGQIHPQHLPVPAGPAPRDPRARPDPAHQPPAGELGLSLSASVQCLVAQTVINPR